MDVDPSLIQINDWAAWIRKLSDFSQNVMSLCNNFWFLHHYLSITFSSSVAESHWLQQTPKRSAAELWQIYHILLATGKNLIQSGMFSYAIERMYNPVNSTCGDLINYNLCFSSARLDFLRVNCIIIALSLCSFQKKKDRLQAWQSLHQKMLSSENSCAQSPYLMAKCTTVCCEGQFFRNGL